MTGRKQDRGFSLIELLIVVTIIGLLLAISVVNYRNAIERARQRRSMADMRAISTGIETYAADFGRYPPPAGFTMPQGLSLPTSTIGPMSAYLQPTYLKYCPVSDGWNSWFTYGTGNGSTDYAVRSNGRDGSPEAAPTYGPTTEFNADIILVDGKFVQFPDGVQR